MNDFPDYEAADGAGGGVLWPYEPEIRIKMVRKIVDAALGDRVLFEKCEHSEFTHNGRLRRLRFDNGVHHVTFDETPDHSCYECRDSRDGRHTKDEGWYCNGEVQMWPKKDNDG